MAVLLTHGNDFGGFRFGDVVVLCAAEGPPWEGGSTGRPVQSEASGDFSMTDVESPARDL